jgi:hypothetical protein
MKTSINISNGSSFSKLAKVAVFLFLLLPLNLLSQDILTYSQKIPIESGKRKKILKDMIEWISTQSNLTLKQDSQEDILELYGSFPFENPVKYEASATYSRMYIQQTNGKISYHITISIKDDNMIFQIGNFKHNPSAKGEKIEFGILTKEETAPANLKLDYDADWCDKVWQCMKKQSEENFLRIMQQLPADLITAR